VFPLTACRPPDASTLSAGREHALPQMNVWISRRIGPSVRTLGGTLKRTATRRNLKGTDPAFRRTSSQIGFGRERGPRGARPLPVCDPRISDTRAPSRPYSPHCGQPWRHPGDVCRVPEWSGAEHERRCYGRSRASRLDEIRTRVIVTDVRLDLARTAWHCASG
jgi:hypothetical protein